MDAQTEQADKCWIYRHTVLFEDAEYRLVICEYEAIQRPDLCLEYADGYGGWVEQVPMPIDAEKARAIADALKSWSVRIVHEYYEKKRQTEAAKYGEDAVDEAETFAHYADCDRLN
jgi:hypothetical protein